MVCKWVIRLKYRREEVVGQEGDGFEVFTVRAGLRKDLATRVFHRQEKRGVRDERKRRDSYF